MGRAPTSQALAKRNDFDIIPSKKLTQHDVSDASLPTLHRATVLRTPQALAVSKALASINGRPLGDRLLILPLPSDDHFGRIIIPENAKEDQTCGIVVSVGKGRYENGVLIPPEVLPGNYVVFSKYAARKVRVADIEVYQVAEADIAFAAGHSGE